MDDDKSFSCEALRAIDAIQEKSAIKLYLNSVFQNLKEEVDDLIVQFTKLYGFIDLSDEDGGVKDFPHDFKKAMLSARHACVQLERMSESNRELLQRVLGDQNSLSEEVIHDLMDKVKRETATCSREMTKVLRRFDNVNSSLHKFVAYLRSEADDQHLSRTTIQKFQEIIPWNYIPNFITDLLETLATPRGKSDGFVFTQQRDPVRARPPKECLKFAEQLIEPLRRVVEAWGVLLRQVILVSRLLANSHDFLNADRDAEEVKELYDFFGCLREATRDFVDYIPGRKKSSKHRRRDSETMLTVPTPIRALPET